MTLNDVIYKIQMSNNLSAATRNSLHGALKGHPWCEGKDLNRRKHEVLFSVAGKSISGVLLENIMRCQE